jgi:acyl-CoA thioesterase
MGGAHDGFAGGAGRARALPDNNKRETMTDFEQATAIEGADGRYTARLSDDWCVWSAAGGYLIAVALRAAGREATFPEPLSLSCHFLAAPKLDLVQLTVTSLRKTRVAESLRVSMQQDGKPVIELLVWCGAPVEGYAHEDALMPEVAEPQALALHQPQAGVPGFQTLWQHLEHRPCGPLHWQEKQAAPPRQRDWIRLRDFPDRADPFLEAGRYAVVLDSFTWPAAAHAYAGDPRFVAPTISFSIELHRRTSSAWLLSDAYAPCAVDGRIAIHNRLWSPDKKLIATGNGTLICRPRPQR